MSNPTARPPPTDDALDILRRLEPAITKLDGRLDKIDGRLDRIEAEQLRHVEAIAELRGKVSVLPTLWQIVGPMVAIYAAISGLALAIGGWLARH